MKRLTLALLFVCLAILIGCGGGGGTQVPTTKVHFSVNWGERSRALAGPGSALSMVLKIEGAGVPSGDLLYLAVRDADPAAHAFAYVTPQLAKSGPHTVTATFYADAAGAGDVVGVATGMMTLNADGTLSGDISTVGTVAAVEVLAGQSVGVGETRQLSFSAKDSVGGLIAVSPGSAHWAVVTGPDLVTFESGYAKGLATGAAEVTATVDGHTSASTPLTITATSAITVAIDPQTAVVAPNGTKQFTATVTGNPNTAVTWKVLTVGGGTISGTGLYTAPNNVMFATVEAKSVADPSKIATALVTVQRATLTVTVSPNPATVAANATKEFTAVVDGSPNQGVVWSVVESNGGSISFAGLYTAPSIGGTYTVKAVSVADPTASGTAVVNVPLLR